MGVGTDQTMQYEAELSPITSRETGHADMSLAAGGAGGEIPLSRRDPEEGAVHNKN